MRSVWLIDTVGKTIAITFRVRVRDPYSLIYVEVIIRYASSHPTEIPQNFTIQASEACFQRVCYLQATLVSFISYHTIRTVSFQAACLYCTWTVERFIYAFQYIHRLKITVTEGVLNWYWSHLSVTYDRTTNLLPNTMHSMKFPSPQQYFCIKYSIYLTIHYRYKCSKG